MKRIISKSFEAYTNSWTCNAVLVVFEVDFKE